MCVNVSWTTWAIRAWGWIFPGGSPPYFCHPLHNLPYADTLCYLLPLLFCLSLTHSHLPRYWTASNRAWWLKEMSVHSLIIPPSASVLTVLIQSYRAYWNCSFFESHGVLLPFVGFLRVCVCVHAVYSIISSLFYASVIDFAVLQ